MYFQESACVLLCILGLFCHSQRLPRPTGEVNILEIIAQFKAHHVYQHADFDMRTHSFGPLAATAVMTVFREYVDGKSECGAETLVKQKVEDMLLFSLLESSQVAEKEGHKKEHDVEWGDVVMQKVLFYYEACDHYIIRLL